MKWRGNSLLNESLPIGTGVVPYCLLPVSMVTFIYKDVIRATGLDVTLHVLYRNSRVVQKGGFSMTILKLLLAIVIAAQLSGCVFTKIVTVPMRVGGAIVSVVPVAGNVAHAGIDSAAEAVDALPF
jgi:hypothetical protein